MFTLAQSPDKFRLLLPDEFIPEEIEAKYTKILTDAHSFITKPIDFLNETIQKVDVLGFNSASVAQSQTNSGTPLRSANRIYQNEIQGGTSDVYYRSATNPLSLIDKTLNIDFRHTLGYVNYFLLFESFMYQYSRDTQYLKHMDFNFNVDIMNENGAIYSRVVLMHPIIDGIDMLSFDYTQPNPSSRTFRCIWKYDNFDYQFINTTSRTCFDNTQAFEIPISTAKANKRNEDESFNRYPYESETETLSNLEIESRVEDTSDGGRTRVDENGITLKNPISHENEWN